MLRKIVYSFRLPRRRDAQEVYYGLGLHALLQSRYPCVPFAMFLYLLLTYEHRPLPACLVGMQLESSHLHDPTQIYVCLIAMAVESVFDVLFQPRLTLVFVIGGNGLGGTRIVICYPDAVCCPTISRTSLGF